MTVVLRPSPRARVNRTSGRRRRLQQERPGSDTTLVVSNRGSAFLLWRHRARATPPSSLFPTSQNLALELVDKLLSRGRAARPAEVKVDQLGVLEGLHQIVDLGFRVGRNVEIFRG